MRAVFAKLDEFNETYFDKYYSIDWENIDWSEDDAFDKAVAASGIDEFLTGGRINPKRAGAQSAALPTQTPDASPAPDSTKNARPPMSVMTEGALCWKEADGNKKTDYYCKLCKP